MASELCMNCFSVKGKYEVCPFCGYAEGTPPSQPHYLVPGTILGNHFIVGTVIGMGGFGITYKCYDTTLGVIVAVKEFYPAGLVNRAPGERRVGLLSGEKKTQYQEQLKRFMVEAQSIAQFGKAKDIVNVYDYFEENNTAYIIMEYIDGVLLKDYLEKQGRIHDMDTVLSIITPVIEAVKKIHAKGIIHRDISPDNIFIAGDESVKVFDFGAAQLNSTKEGMAGEKVIKVGYSAPEQYRDRSKQGYYTDIYSIGAILYQMVTGIKPVESTEREYKDELKSPLELGIKIDSNFDRAIMEALAVKPELRFQNIQQLSDAIEGKRIAEYPKVKLKKRKRKRNWMIGLSVSLTLAILVVIGLFQTVWKKTNPLIDSSIKSEEVVVWVDNADVKEEINSDIAEVFSEPVSGESEELTKIKKENAKVKDKIKVVDVTTETSYGTMDAALQATKGTKEFPDMFLSDRVADPEQYSLTSLKDIYDTIDISQYLYMSQYPTYFKNYKEMPTALDVLQLYVYDTSAMDEQIKKKAGMSSSSFADRKKDTIEIKDVIEANNEQEITYSDAYFSTIATFLTNREGFDYKKGTLNFDGAFAGKMTQFSTMNQKANGKPWIFDGKPSGLYGSSALAGAGYRSKLNGSNDALKQLAYVTYAATVDDKMLISYADKYAISAKSDKNSQLICKRLLWCLLDQSDVKVSANDAYPIRKQKFETFFQTGNNARQTKIKKLIDRSQACILLGKGTGNISNYANRLTNFDRAAGYTEKEINDICATYLGEQK